jgi:hypothetical protein
MLDAAPTPIRLPQDRRETLQQLYGDTFRAVSG